jgi:hypothetical protein
VSIGLEWKENVFPDAIFPPIFSQYIFSFFTLLPLFQHLYHLFFHHPPLSLIFVSPIRLFIFFFSCKTTSYLSFASPLLEIWKGFVVMDLSQLPVFLFLICTSRALLNLPELRAISFCFRSSYFHFWTKKQNTALPTPPLPHTQHMSSLRELKYFSSEKYCKKYRGC